MLRFLFLSVVLPVSVFASSKLSTQDSIPHHLLQSDKPDQHCHIAQSRSPSPSGTQNVLAADTSLVVDDIVNPIISDMKRDFSGNPLVQHVKEIKTRKQAEQDPFLPYMTFFVNSFSDINRMLLPYSDEEILTTDNVEDGHLKALINEHCEEDSTHHYLFWKDLEHYDTFLRDQIGLRNFSDIVRFLWSDDLYDMRKLSYEVGRLAGMASKPIHRYCMIRVMEEVGNVFFTTGVDYKMIGGVPSAYMGHDHLDLENGHLQSRKNNTNESSSVLVHRDHDNKHATDEDNTALHEDALTQVFGSMRFQSVEESNTAKYVMKATYKLFDDMLHSAFSAMRKRETSVSKEGRPSLQ